MGDCLASFWLTWFSWFGLPLRLSFSPAVLETMRAEAHERHRLLVNAVYGDFDALEKASAAEG